jgi:esterase/lipase superfamily enzyme
MDALSAIMTAIISGVVASAKPTTEKAIAHLYDGLKALIQRKYNTVSLEAIEKKPDSEAKQASLREDLQEAKADQDNELLTQAQALLKAISEQPPQLAQAIGIKLEDVKAANVRLQEIIVSGEQAGGVHIKHGDIVGDIKISTVKVEASGKKSQSLDEALDRYSIRGACVVPDSEEYEFLMSFHPIMPIEINNSLYSVWYGTTRKPIDRSDLSKGFKNERDNGNVHYGKCNVFIPKSHRFGETGRSWFQRWIKLDFENDNLKLREINPCNSADSFWLELKNQFAENKGDALVFLHGYNNSFEESAIRAAQIGFDLKVSGATAFFSWPSKSEVSGYPDDVASIEASEIAITDFLLDFTKKSGASKVHLIAHSMGNRGLIRALNNIQHKLEKDSAVPFGQIILAAPDLDVQLFQNLAYLYPMLSERTTLYASRKDKAVAASKWLHGSPRVGIAPPITVVDKIDTVEVETKSFSLFFELGHSYFAEAESILHDMYDLLRHNSEPSDRQRLREEKTETGAVYWLMSS